MKRKLNLHPIPVDIYFSKSFQDLPLAEKRDILNLATFVSKHKKKVIHRNNLTQVSKRV